MNHGTRLLGMLIVVLASAPMAAFGLRLKTNLFRRKFFVETFAAPPQPGLQKSGSFN